MSNLVMAMSDIATLLDKQNKKPLLEVTMQPSLRAVSKVAYVKIWHPGRSRAGEPSVSIEVNTGNPLTPSATFSPEQLRVARQWVLKYREQLTYNWKLVQAFKQPLPINSDWTTTSQAAATPRLKTVVPLEGYQLNLTYADGFSSILQLEPFIKGTGSPLLNSTEFATAQIKKGFIAWDCGVDMDPEEIYEFLRGFKDEAA